MAKPADLRPPQPGEVLQGTDFCIQRFLGAGATAEVYEATSPRLGRCALKLLSPRFTLRSDVGARLRREARLLSELRHLNIVEVLDFGSAGGRFYLAMALLRGANLRERVARRPMTWREAVEIAAATLDGLEAAHRAGVIHRDVKPENVFIGNDGVTKVIDFGIAKIENRSVVTEPGLVMGTPAYMSPEQVMGEPIDGRSDVYSVGVLLYELLAGRRPFNGTDPGAVAAMRVRRDPPSVGLFARAVPASLRAAVDRSLRSAPELRFQTAAELSSALRESLAVDPLTAPDVPLPRAILEVSRSALTRTSKAPASSPSPPVSGIEPRPADPVALTNRLHFVTWGDVFVLVDHGRAQPHDYEALGDLVLAEARKHPGGIGGLAIIPRKATPPSSEARQAMGTLMQRLGTSLRCFSWLVEGRGFQAAMVRAVLTGVQLVGRVPCELHVATDMGEAVGWIVERLDGNKARLPHVEGGARWIEDERRRSERERPPHPAS